MHFTLPDYVEYQWSIRMPLTVMCRYQQHIVMHLVEVASTYCDLLSL